MSKCFQRLAKFVLFKKFTIAYLFQIAWENHVISSEKYRCSYMMCNCSDTEIDPNLFPPELLPADILNNGWFSCFSNIQVSNWAKNPSRNAFF